MPNESVLLRASWPSRNRPYSQIRPQPHSDAVRTDSLALSLGDDSQYVEDRHDGKRLADLPQRLLAGGTCVGDSIGRIAERPLCGPAEAAYLIFFSWGFWGLDQLLPQRVYSSSLKFFHSVGVRGGGKGIGRVGFSSVFITWMAFFSTILPSWKTL